MPTIAKAFRLKLYPTAEQAADFVRFAGSCRWLWNHMLQLQQERHAADGTFIFRFDMDKMLPGLKVQYPWLAIAPSASLKRVCRNLDLALRRSFKSQSKRAGFPHFKKRLGRQTFYVQNTTLRISDRTIVLPKVGPVRFRAGRLPEGKILGANVALEGNAWYCTIQCAVEVTDAAVVPRAATVIGLDTGIHTLAFMSDGERVAIPRTTRRHINRVKRLQKKLARQQRDSANREKTRRRLAATHADLANIRRDCRHKLTRALVDRASAVVIEDLNVAGMVSEHLSSAAMSRSLRIGVAAAGMSEVRRMLTYKTAWAGKTLVVADRYFPSTQACSACGNVKTGLDRLPMKRRTFRCGCGHTMNRDLNAAMNLRRYGLMVLGMPIDGNENEPPGQAMPRGLGSQS